MAQRGYEIHLCPGFRNSDAINVCPGRDLWPFPETSCSLRIQTLLSLKGAQSWKGVLLSSWYGGVELEAGQRSG